MVCDYLTMVSYTLVDRFPKELFYELGMGSPLKVATWRCYKLPSTRQYVCALQHTKYTKFFISNFYIWWLSSYFVCGNECGIFVISFAEHTAHCREVALTQPDIWYYREKIAIDIYASRWEMTDVEEDNISLETNV